MEIQTTKILKEVEKMGNIYMVVSPTKKEEVMKDTWGHLAPEPRKKYPCKLLIATNRSDSIIVEQDFGGLPDSPWLYDDTQDFLYESVEVLEPGIYLFVGWYKQFKNGKGIFGGGKFQKVTINTIIRE